MRPHIDKRFAFISLAYNHAEHVVKHLESIRYQVVHHGAGIEVVLVVTDDCSGDETRKLISSWVSKYEDLFASVRLVYPAENLGTCEILRRAIHGLQVDGFKITGADDIYGPANIFDHAFLDPPTAMVTATPIAIYGDRLVVRKRELLEVILTNAVYRRAKLINRVRHLSAHNAPNIIYSGELIKADATRELLTNFRFIEDWCLMFALASQMPDGKVINVRDTFVYHRHSLSHVYLNRRDPFRADKVRMFDMLLACSDGGLGKWRVRSRRSAFLAGGGPIRYLLMPDFYAFLIAAVLSMPRFIIDLVNLKVDMRRHEAHLFLVSKQASEYLKSLEG